MPTISHALTVDGRARSPNEDAYLADDALRLYAVADGVSTGAAGEIAAQRAIQVLHEAFQEAVEA
ncbi:MAG: serine/threonine-protein phosphatase, partial [Myxococcales bacterium]|nr:serine/threonine-protein phosphatase [Myxococcales bacterium]